MSISFNDIPTNLRVPFCYVEFDSSRAQQNANTIAYRGLLIGQKLAAGTAVANTPVRVTSAAQAKTLFGAGSQLALMCAAWLENNSVTELYAGPLDDDDAAVAATGTVTIGGAPTAAGTLSLYIGGQRVRVSVATTDTPATIAAALVTAITAATDLPVTAANVDGVITLTAKNKGAAGNYIDVRVNYYDGEALPTGVTATIVAMSGGSANPELADLIAAMGDTWYHVIATAYTDASTLAELYAEMEDRAGPLRQIDGVVFAAATGTHSELGTLGDAHNDPYLSIMHCHGSPTTPFEWAAAVASVAAYYGNIDPARPFQTLAIDGVLAPADADLFTLQENNLLLYDGISTFSVDANGACRIQRLITTYKTNAAGADDTAYLDVNSPLTLMYLRYDFRTHILNKYPRHKLANDGTRYGAGQAVITPKVGKAEAIAKFRQWEELGLVEDVDQFKADLICERNATDPNRLDWMMPPNLVNQFRVAAVQIGFLL